MVHNMYGCVCVSTPKCQENNKCNTRNEKNKRNVQEEDRRRNKNKNPSQKGIVENFSSSIRYYAVVGSH